MLKATETGTITNAAGWYTLAVAGDSSVLVLCTVGYVCRELPSRRNNLNLTPLPETQALHAQQLVGYDTRLNPTFNHSYDSL